MFPVLAPITRILILVNVVVFGMEMLFRGQMLYYLALWPWGSEAALNLAPFGLWQLVTYGFLHSPNWYPHIIFNMLALFMFGSDVERSMGEKRYLAYYFTCIIGAGLAQLVSMAVGIAPKYLVVGASGAVFGILLAFAIAFPDRRLIMFPIPIPIPARVFVAIYAALELYLGIFARNQGIAHFAHLGGAAAGYLLILYWRHAPR